MSKEPRHLTNEEYSTFNFVTEHSNFRNDSYCCPYCLESHIYKSPYFLAQSDYPDNVRVATCKNCDKEFPIWIETQITYVSGKF